MKTLKWKLNPPTINFWAQFFLKEWDLYIQHFSNNNFVPDLLQSIAFKEPNEQSY